MPTMMNSTTSPNISLGALSSSPGANMESAANSDTFHDSNRPQRGAAAAAAEIIAQIAEDSPTDDAPKKKKTPAAFQLSAKVIPNDAGLIKVSSP